ncbi:MAG: hypothetical protein KDA91_19140 [Planctomycetaceae bacterium]|nr:hypothetical protein [Planctomycetaceae bacterium]
MRRNWSIRTAPETNRKICRHRASFRRPGTKQSDSSDQAGSGSSILQKIDGRTDVYSLGVVMSEMLSGRKPYRAATPIEMLREVMEREPRPLRQIDETLLPNSAWFLDNSDIPGPNRYDNGLHPVG